MEEAPGKGILITPKALKIQMRSGACLVDRCPSVLGGFSHFQVVLRRKLAEFLTLENVVLVHALQLVGRVIPYPVHLEYITAMSAHTD